MIDKDGYWRDPVATMPVRQLTPQQQARRTARIRELFKVLEEQTMTTTMHCVHCRCSIHSEAAKRPCPDQMPHRFEENKEPTMSDGTSDRRGEPDATRDNSLQNEVQRNRERHVEQVLIVTRDVHKLEAECTAISDQLLAKRAEVDAKRAYLRKLLFPLQPGGW